MVLHFRKGMRNCYPIIDLPSNHILNRWMRKIIWWWMLILMASVAFVDGEGSPPPFSTFEPFFHLISQPLLLIFSLRRGGVAAAVASRLCLAGANSAWLTVLTNLAAALFWPPWFFVDDWRLIDLLIIHFVFFFVPYMFILWDFNHYYIIISIS